MFYKPKENEYYIRVGNIKVEKFTRNIPVDGFTSKVNKYFTHKSTGIYFLDSNGKRHFITKYMMFDIDLKVDPESNKSYSAQCLKLYNQREAILKHLISIIGVNPYCIIRNKKSSDIDPDILENKFKGNIKNAGMQVFFKIDIPVDNKSVFWLVYKRVHKEICKIVGSDIMANGDFAKNPEFVGAWDVEYPDCGLVNISALYQKLFNEPSDVYIKSLILEKEYSYFDIEQDIIKRFNSWNFKDNFNKTLEEAKKNIFEKKKTIHSGTTPSDPNVIYISDDYKESSRNRTTFNFMIKQNINIVQNVTFNELKENGLYSNCDIKEDLDSEEFEAVRQSVLSYKSTSEGERLSSTRKSKKIYQIIESKALEDPEYCKLLELSERYKKIKNIEFSNSDEKYGYDFFKTMFSRNIAFANKYSLRVFSITDMKPKVGYSQKSFVSFAVAKIILAMGIGQFFNNLGSIVDNSAMIWDIVSKDYESKSKYFISLESFVEGFKEGCILASKIYHTKLVTNDFLENENEVKRAYLKGNGAILKKEDINIDNHSRLLYNTVVSILGFYGIDPEQIKSVADVKNTVWRNTHTELPYTFNYKLLLMIRYIKAYTYIKNRTKSAFQKVIDAKKSISYFYDPIHPYMYDIKKLKSTVIKIPEAFKTKSYKRILYNIASTGSYPDLSMCLKT